MAETNLASDLSPLVGRDAELAAVLEGLAASPLVTLTGPAGAGKTRLAIEAGLRLLTADREVWLVDLASVSDPADVPGAVAAAVGLAENPRTPLMTALPRFLRARHQTVVLDNCEHVLAACQRLVEAALGQEGPGALLATSQRRLDLPGEIVVDVEPLAVPPDNAEADDLLTSPAVQLFVQRAREVDPRFALTPANAAGVAAVCRALDGLPLALELGAALTRVVDPGDLAARLEDRLDVLVSPSPGAPARHRSLRAALQWSTDLLDEPQRELLAQLSVFRGGATLDAVQAVCTVAGKEPGALVPALAGLVEASLIQVRRRDRERRYWLLDSVQAHAAELLTAAGRDDRIRAAHAAFFVDLAESADAAMHGPAQQDWAERLDRERFNMASALEWAVGADPVSAVRLTAALGWFWWRHTAISEGAGWMERVLPLRDVVDGGLQARLLLGSSWLRYMQGALDVALGHSSEAVAAARSVGAAEALAFATWFLGYLRLVAGDLDEAEVQLEQAGEQAEAAGLRWLLAYVVTITGLVHAARGQLAEGVDCIEQGAAMSTEVGDLWGEGLAQWALTPLVLGLREVDKAITSAVKTIELSVRMHHLGGVFAGMHALAACFALRGRAADGARLLGAADTLSDTYGLPIRETLGETAAADEAVVCEHLDAPTFTARYEEGAVLNLEEALLLALGERPSR